MSKVSRKEMQIKDAPRELVAGAIETLPIIPYCFNIHLSHKDVLGKQDGEKDSER